MQHSSRGDFINYLELLNQGQGMRFIREIYSYQADVKVGDILNFDIFPKKGREIYISLPPPNRPPLSLHPP